VMESLMSTCNKASQDPRSSSYKVVAKVGQVGPNEICSRAPKLAAPPTNKRSK
jgi:hypothetical protein